MKNTALLLALLATGAQAQTTFAEYSLNIDFQLDGDK